MAWNSKKQKYECDRCGEHISNTNSIQLCSKCRAYLEDLMKDKRKIGVEVVPYNAPYKEESEDKE